MISAKVFPFETAGVKGIKKEEVKERERSGPEEQRVPSGESDRLGWLSSLSFSTSHPFWRWDVDHARCFRYYSRESERQEREETRQGETTTDRSVRKMCSPRGKFRGRKTRPTDSVRSRASARAFVERGYQLRFFFFALTLARLRVFDATWRFSDPS